MPWGLQVGDPENAFLLSSFPKSKSGFLQKSCEDFPCSSKLDPTLQPWVGSQSCVPAGRGLDETRDSTANLLQILLSFRALRGFGFGDFAEQFSKSKLLLETLFFFFFSDGFFSLLIWTQAGNRGVTGRPALLCVRLQLPEVATSLEEII